MNHTQMTSPETPGDSYTVEFYPTVEDYVYISAKVSSSFPHPTAVTYTYQVFLVVNAICFPAFLWFMGYFVAGVIVLATNIAALSWLIPWFNNQGVKKYYEHFIGPRENEIARVELTSEGVRYLADDAEAFWPWRRIDMIDEQDESIYFFFDGNGFAVRKSGFAYRDQQTEFLDFARQSLIEAKRKQLAQ